MVRERTEVGNDEGREQIGLHASSRGAQVGPLFHQELTSPSSFDFRLKKVDFLIKQTKGGKVEIDPLLVYKSFFWQCCFFS